MATLHLQSERGWIQKLTGFVNIALKSLGQIMLQNNAVTGLLFLFGIFFGSITMGIAALLAVCCGNLTAKFLRYPKEEIKQGLYGFSAALVGVALILFYKPVFGIWFFIAIGSILATIIQHFFIRKKIPVFTLPFVMVTWALIFLINTFFPEMRIIAPASVIETHDFAFAIKGYAQVIFQDNITAGILFFVAVFVSSPVAALYGLAGGIVTAILSLHFSVPVTDIEVGLYSFNAVLCGIVFAGDKPKDGIWALLAVVLSFSFSWLIFKYELIQLTFPFVAASFITVMLKERLFVKKK